MRMAGDVREQLDSTTPAKKVKLIDVFEVFLKRIADTFQRCCHTEMDWPDLDADGRIDDGNPTDVKANGQAAELLASSADTFEGLLGDDPAVSFQFARAKRLVGDYRPALNELEKVLVKKPMMLDAQFEAAQAYESWASNIDPKYSSKAFQAALIWRSSRRGRQECHLGMGAN